MGRLGKVMQVLRCKGYDGDATVRFLGTGFQAGVWHEFMITLRKSLRDRAA